MKGSKVRPRSSVLQTIYRPQEIHIEDFYQHHESAQQFRPDLKMKANRKTISEKMSQSSGAGMRDPRMSSAYLERITSAEQFRLRKETDFQQVKPYSRLYFSQQPVSVDRRETQESMQSKQQKLARMMRSSGSGTSHQRQNPSDQRLYYRSQMSGHTRRINELFASQSGNTAPPEDMYQNLDKALLRRSGILD